ncbi:uncharacterized protein N7511_001577 [Penicillium nucicola]|uniref:uncharacterized protein n=1 Tax=Penicillium nucicola TaxID=1850975 RepID=UPI0025450379|nr:uncharacterized protein N7511_001577 [Penicillium nucicola]KAJ5776566.1 hypothetical protein N7511_001577 [Penicillium nucicola]
MFQLTALNFLDTGIDAIFGVQFQSLRGVRDFFPVEDELTSAFIVTPQKERDAAVDGDTSADTSVYYIDGLMYDWAIILLIQKIQALIPGIPVTVHQYQALNAAAPDADEAFDTRRGKALFQYDPQARPGRRGVRLYFEEHRALNHFWAPEERSLSESESQYTTQLSCAGQSYSRVQYTCYSDLLCPILDGIRTLRCAAQCYLESLYTCYDERKLCPVVNGNPTLPCGDDCYLPSEYSCNESKLVQISHNNPEQSAGSTGSSASSTQSTSITTITTSPGDNPSGVPGSHAEIIFSGTTYTIGTQTTTIVQDEHTIIFGPNGLIIGTYTVAFPSSQTEPVALTTDGITITFLPGPTSSASSRTSSSPRSTGQSVTTGPTPGPTPTSVLPSSTSNPTSFPSLPAATSTVLTLTALDGLSTVEITYTPTTISQLTTITGTTTVTTNIDGLPTSIVVGPGGLVWKSVTASTRITGFPPIPEPTIPPVPRSSSALPTQTSTLTSDDMFPSSQFTLPPIVTTVVTSDSPDGPVATTITGTTDSSGVVVPITTLSAAAAISSAISLASELSSVSDAVIAFSSSTADSSKASSAAAVIKDAQSGTSGFGHGAGFILDSIGNTLSAILDGTASLGSLTGPLTEISVIASELVDDAKEAEAIWPTGGGIAIWSYPGYTYTTVSPDPTDLPQADENGDPITSTVEPSTTQPSSTPSPISSSTETSSVTTETLPVTTDVPSTTTTQTPTSTTDAPADMMTGCNHIKSNFPNDPETCNEFVENFDVTVTKLMELNPILRSSDATKIVPGAKMDIIVVVFLDAMEC